MEKQMIDAMLRNQREKEEVSPSPIPLAGPWRVPASQWHLLDRRLAVVDRREIPEGTCVTYLNKRDAYASQREASDDAHAPLVMMALAFAADNVKEPTFKKARVL